MQNQTFMGRTGDNLGRPISGGGNLNHTSSSSTSSSSSLSTSPSFLSSINAAIRNRRPLGTKHEVYRPKRVLVNKSENLAGSISTASVSYGENIPPETEAQQEAERLLSVNLSENKDSSLESRSISSEDSLLTPSSITETVTINQDNNMCLYENQQIISRGRVTVEVPSSSEGLLMEQKSADTLGAIFKRKKDQFDNHGSIETNNMIEKHDNFGHDQKQSVTVPTHQFTNMSSALIPSPNNSLPSKPHHNIDKVASSQVSSSDNPSLNADKEVLQPSKVQKSSHKKKYDPNVFVKVKGRLYQKLGKIGSGGSSEVHKVVSSDCTIYALKKIVLKGRDYQSAYGFCQEIVYLNKLKGKSNIIKLIDYEVTDKILLQEVMSGCMITKDGRITDDQYIYMVLEYGEIDLAHMILQKMEVETSSCKIDDNWLRFYWQQMLEAVNTIHEERIVHSDLKPANFLLVKGSLKLIDFGIAKAILSDTTNIQRDAQVGTLNYMSPEAFMWNEHDPTGSTIKCGRPSDIWSLGCILYQMVYGKTPFANYKTFWAKYKVITDKNHEITYDRVPNPLLIDLMKRCLAYDRNERWRIPQLLSHPFLLPPCIPKLYLTEKISLYRDDPDVSRLCSQLCEVIGKLDRDEEKSEECTP